MLVKSGAGRLCVTLQLLLQTEDQPQLTHGADCFLAALPVLCLAW